MWVFWQELCGMAVPPYPFISLKQTLFKRAWCMAVTLLTTLRLAQNNDSIHVHRMQSLANMQPSELSHLRYAS